MKWIWMVLFVLIGCVVEEAPPVEPLDEQAQLSVTSDCLDDYIDCIIGCSFNRSCRSVCRADLDTCLDAASPPTGGSGSSSCSSSRSFGGITQSAQCTNGQCTCEENGVEVGTCSGDCDLDAGCCAAFF